MADEPEDQANVLCIIQPTEESDAFKTGLLALLNATKPLGPVIHVCLLSQLIGRIVAYNLMHDQQEMRNTMNLNFDVGIAESLQDLMERSMQEGKPN